MHISRKLTKQKHLNKPGSGVGDGIGADVGIPLFSWKVIKNPGRLTE